MVQSSAQISNGKLIKLGMKVFDYARKKKNFDLYTVTLFTSNRDSVAFFEQLFSWSRNIRNNT